KRLDFTKPFMPESLARVESLELLSAAEQILLNQIRGFGYLYTFRVVAEFILPFVLDHARPHLNEDDYRTRALLQFASEEAKHIHLFRKFAEEFKAGFVTYCETIGPPEEIGKAVLSHGPLVWRLSFSKSNGRRRSIILRASATTMSSIRNSRACCA